MTPEQISTIFKWLSGFSWSACTLSIVCMPVLAIVMGFLSKRKKISKLKTITFACLIFASPFAFAYAAEFFYAFSNHESVHKVLLYLSSHG